MNLMTWLAVGVGVALGVLVALLVDGYWLGQRLQAAVTQNRQRQQQLNELASRLQRQQQENDDLLTRSQHLSEQAAGLQESLQTQAEALETAVTDLQQSKDNLNRLNLYAEELETRLSQAHDETAVLTARRDALQSTLTATEEKLAQIAADYDRVCAQLTAVDEARHKLELELAEMAGLQQAQEETAVQLETAEHRISELNAQITGLLQRLTETQSLRRQIVALEEKLQTAVAPKTSAGVNKSAQLLNLRQIRGIGPTFAHRLEEAGIRSIVDVASASLDMLSDAVGLTEAQVVSWQEQARQILEQ